MMAVRRIITKDTSVIATVHEMVDESEIVADHLSTCFVLPNLFVHLPSAHEAGNFRFFIHRFQTAELPVRQTRLYRRCNQIDHTCWEFAGDPRARRG